MELFLCDELKYYAWGKMLLFVITIVITESFVKLMLKADISHDNSSV